MLVIDENEGPKISGKNQQRLFWLINIKIYHAEVEVSILHVCYEDTVYIYNKFLYMRILFIHKW